MGGTCLSRPALCRTQKIPTDAPGPIPRVHRQILNPRPSAKSNRLQIFVDRAEADDAPILFGDENQRRARLHRMPQRDGGGLLAPRRRSSAGRLHQPLKCRQKLPDIAPVRRPNPRFGSSHDKRSMARVYARPIRPCPLFSDRVAGRVETGRDGSPRSARASRSGLRTRVPTLRILRPVRLVAASFVGATGWGRPPTA